VPRVLTLDPKATHEGNPDCPSRLVPAPDGRNWVCIDCGCYILMKYVEVVEVPERVRQGEPGWWLDENGRLHPPKEIGNG